MLSDDTLVKCKEYWPKEGISYKTFREIKANTSDYGPERTGYRLSGVNS